MVKSLPFWVWFALAQKIHEGGLHRTDRHGAPVLTKLPYTFSQPITLPQVYWDGGSWVMPAEPISEDDPGEGRSRLYTWFQRGGYGRNKTFWVSRRWFPKGTGFSWRYTELRSRFKLSADAARLAISIEEGREFSSSALKMRISREREVINDILGKLPVPQRIYKGVYPGWYTLVQMFGGVGKVIKIPRDFGFYTPWRPEVIVLSIRLSKIGKPYRIPQTPPRNVTVSETEPAPVPT